MSESTTPSSSRATRGRCRAGAGLAITWLALSVVATPLTAATARPVVVELFTSQGCSSCPPADRLLSRLGAEPESPVIALAYHVDYWNHLGWRDPFSRREWSQRQEAYARGLETHLYTPQAVVDGRVHLVGSDERELRAAVAAARSRPAASLTLSLTPRAADLVAQLEVSLPDVLRRRKLEVMLADYESGLVTAVARGENGGRSLRDDFVVRRLQRAGVLQPGGPERSRFEISWARQRDRRRSRQGLAAFVQDPASREIFGGTSLELDPHLR